VGLLLGNVRIGAGEVAVGVGPVPGLASQTGASDSWLGEFSADGRFFVFASLASNLTHNDSNGALDIFLRNLTARTTRLVSVNLLGRESGDGASIAPAASADGRWVAFESRAVNLVAGDTNGFSDVFVRDMVAGVTELVSADVDGLPCSVGASSAPAISADGRFVAFESLATNLVSGIDDTNAGSDVFLRDRLQARTLLVSRQWNTNRAGNSASANPAFSADGSRLVFTSLATNLVEGSTNTLGEVFVYDLAQAATLWVSRDAGAFRTAVSNGVPATARYHCCNPAISADGRYVAFKIVVEMTGTPGGVLRHDLLTGNTELVGTNAPGTFSGGNDASGPVMSADGRSVAFAGICAGDLLPTGVPGVWRWDAETKQTTLVSVDMTGSGVAVGPFSTGSDTPAISADGRYVAFLSYATNLVSSGANGCCQAYVRDLDQGRTALVSLRRDGLQGGNQDAAAVALSAEGRLVVFQSIADDLVADDFNQANDVFLRDGVTSQTELLSVGRPSSTPAGMSIAGAQSLSASGRRLAFTGHAPNLVAGDSNGVPDVFVHDWDAATNLLVSVNANGSGPANGLSQDALISADGQVVVFTSFASDLVEGFTDTNQVEDVYVRFLSGRTFCVVPGVTAPDKGAGFPSLSADGRYVAYQTRAALTNNTATDANGVSDLYVRDLLGDTNVLASVNFAGTGAGHYPSGLAQLSPDGRWVVFQSQATNLVNPPLKSAWWRLFARDLREQTTRHLTEGLVLGNSSTNSTARAFSADSRIVVFLCNKMDLYVHEFAVNRTTLISTNGTDASVSADGRWVAFQSKLTGSTNRDVFVRDLLTGTNRLVSVGLDGVRGGNGDSAAPWVSGDGRFVMFQSRASNLVANDTNGWTDVFVRDLAANSTLLVSLNAAGTASGNRISTSTAMAGDGSAVVFQSFASDLVREDGNDSKDLFVLRLNAGDLDQDGLPDDWEVAFFGNLVPTAGEDPDQDGLTNRAEYLAGTDPTNAASVLRVLTLTSVGTGQTTLLWSAMAGRVYRVQFKDDLSGPGWTELGAEVTAEGTQATAVDPGADTPAQRYYRVVLVR
jgi:Tol biopolymer transport system component